jgi:hypothetical protein
MDAFLSRAAQSEHASDSDRVPVIGLDNKDKARAPSFSPPGEGLL